MTILIKTGLSLPPANGINKQNALPAHNRVAVTFLDSSHDFVGCHSRLSKGPPRRGGAGGAIGLRGLIVKDFNISTAGNDVECMLSQPKLRDR